LAIAGGLGAAFAARPHDLAFWCGIVAGVSAGAAVYLGVRYLGFRIKFFRGPPSAKVESLVFLFYMTTFIGCCATTILISWAVRVLIQNLAA
jgi:hypothetical protein